MRCAHRQFALLLALPLALTATGDVASSAAAVKQNDGIEATAPDVHDAPHPALAALARLLRDDDAKVRLAAAEALDSLDHAALPVISDIARARAALTDAEANDADRAARILRGALADLAEPPPGATVLFDGADLSHWRREGGGEIGWSIVEGTLQVAPGSGSIVTAEPVTDFHLHLEFQLPRLPDDVTGQSRGNSGVYIQQRYEVQILDSFDLEAGPRDCGGLYGYKAPDRNASRPPGEWQRYHIRFRQPRWQRAGEDWVKTHNARITVVHNGVLIHDDVELPDKTGMGYAESPQPRPLRLQDHGNPVRFRNIWIAPLNAATSPPRAPTTSEGTP
jgi:hypothetical protein